MAGFSAGVQMEDPGWEFGLIGVERCCCFFFFFGGGDGVDIPAEANEVQGGS